MCGIVGWIDFTKRMKEQQDIVLKMTRTLANRGPDAENVWTTDSVAFGHRRLAVVDIDGGRQPMTRTTERGDYTVCYNGELYNTEELRQELHLKGYRFRGHSDTEVLLTSYIEWKEHCVEKLNGIFAFAIWDAEAETLFIARDRLGVKPLFYANTSTGLLFASEIKALLAHPEVSPTLTREGLTEVLALGPSRKPGSGVFHGISELRPAHAILYSNKSNHIYRYWNVQSQAHEHSLEETIEEVRYLVSDAIQKQLVSDVPLCTFLSGGLDSSAISAVANKTYNEKHASPLHTYSIDFAENYKHFMQNHFQPTSDAPYIEKMTTHLSSTHRAVTLSQEYVAALLYDALLARDMPGMADVDSSLLGFSRIIRSDFTVALSGECADEIFGGYPWFHSPETHNKTFPWIRSSKERGNLLRDTWQKRLALEEFAYSSYAELTNEAPLLPGESEEQVALRKLFYINMTSFMATLLERKDRMSMAASLEVRVPFADHRLVEYAWNIPWEMKNLQNQEKGILRKAMEGILPHDVLYRKKSPYPKTHHPQFAELVQAQLVTVLKHKSSILQELFDYNQLQQLLDTRGSSFTTPWFGQLMTGPQLLAYLLQFHYWFEEYGIQLVES
ncbi:asparagine synthase (glutamine-hydrolyzing) [Paenisporosarcina cavernae]|uniref:asparagine synthase (glutamine-hydrolyzing) n=1 Tax=Paenisporosarcina cavernae TaxID=2320858 RepID=A0A385YWP8_9BACL|nr:asparagine synthase (glutamine-hydrolyzing) [Paenisporosarcina cavernae]AYC30327.1 asparagine synthase (glutamine-hydrolyzing) [Paenisporosarcina cavernae]